MYLRNFNKLYFSGLFNSKYYMIFFETPLFRPMDYLEVCYLMSTCLEVFFLFQKCMSTYSKVYISDHILNYFNTSKIVKMCFMLHLGDSHICTRKRMSVMQSVEPCSVTVRYNQLMEMLRSTSLPVFS